MLDLFKKAFWLLEKRPLQFLGLLGQYWRFQKAHFFSRLFLTPRRGFYFGKNVRIQRIRCLSAERPGATIQIGDDSIVYEKAQIEAYGGGKIAIGASCILGEIKIFSRASVQLGDRVVTSWNVFIQDFDPHPIDPGQRKAQLAEMCENFVPRYRPKRALQPLGWKFSTEAVEIGDDVWLGANCTILRGAKIGRGSVVATGAVVTRGEYPEGAILAGVPARVVKQLNIIDIKSQ